MNKALVAKVVLMVCLIAELILHSDAQAESSVWKVEFEKDVVLLAGTVHILRPSDYPLPGEFDRAYAASDKVYFETDIAGFQSPEVQQKMMTKMMYQDGRSLSSVLSSELFQKLSEASAARGIDINLINSFRASMAVMMLTVVELQHLGIGTEGVDSHFRTKAQQDGIPVGQLESIDDHLDFITAMGEGSEEKFVELSLRDIERTSEMFGIILTSWRAGNAEALEDLFVSAIKQDYPELYQQLLVDRNRNWLPQIVEMLELPGTELVLVGVGHLTGPEGLLEMLRKRGYKVSYL